MSQKPLVSVIIPVYNGTNYLEEALQSVFGQTYKNYEIVVVDDGSTDGTWALIQKYNSRIRAFRKENGGTSSSLNLGIKYASGDLICWLSHDDLFMPDKLEKQVEFMIQNPRYSMSHTDYIVIDANGVELAREILPWFERSTMLRLMFLDNYIHGCTTIINKNIFAKVGFFNEKLKCTQDLEMWIRIMRYYEIGKLSMFSIKSRVHEHQGSRNKNNLFREQKKLYERIFIDIQKNGWGFEEKPIKNFNEQKEFAWFADSMLKNKYAFFLSLKYYLRALTIRPIRDNAPVLKNIFSLFFKKAVACLKFPVCHIKKIIHALLKRMKLHERHER